MPTFNVEVPEMYRYLVANTVDEVVEKVMIRLHGGGLEALNDQSMVGSPQLAVIASFTNLAVG